MSETQNIQNIELSQLYPYPGNVRTDLGDTNELADSIKAQGIVQALVVRPHPAREGDFQVVMGHRRLAAAKQAGLLAVPCQVRADLDSEAKVIEVMMVENLQRTDLTKSEEGRGYQTLIDLGLSINQVAKRTGRAHKTVADRASLAGLDSKVQHQVDSGDVPLDRAIKLSDFDDDPETQQELAKSISSPQVFDYNHRVACEKREWDTWSPLAYENCVRLGLTAKSVEEVARGHKTLGYDLPISAEEVSKMDETDLPDEITKSIDEYCFVLNHALRQMQWYRVIDEKPEAGPTPEELAEQKAREEAETALRVSKAQFIEHMRDIISKPKKIAGSAVTLLAREMAQSWIEEDYAEILGVPAADESLSGAERTAYYSEAFMGFTADQLALAKFMHSLGFAASNPARDLFDVNSFSPGHYRYSISEDDRSILADHFNWNESKGEELARAFWEPKLPETSEEEVNF